MKKGLFWKSPFFFHLSCSYGLEFHLEAHLPLTAKPSFRDDPLIDVSVNPQSVFVEKIEDISEDRYHHFFDGNIFLEVNVERPVSFIPLIVSLARGISGSEPRLRFPVRPDKGTVGVEVALPFEDGIGKPGLEGH